MKLTSKETYAKVLDNMSNIARTYVRISSLKTALTVFLVGYTALKAVAIFKNE